MSVLELLSSSNFISVNKSIAAEVGLEAAVILGELASEHNYWSNRNELEDGYFYSTVENLQEKTFLSGHNQRIALEKLTEKGWIDIKKKGLPAKRYIKLNEEQILLFFVNDNSLKILTTGDKNFEEQDIQNFNVNNNISNNNIEEEYIDKLIEGQEPEKQENSFLSVEEVMFEEFWKAYPQCFRKVNKKGCKSKFLKIKNLKEIFPDIIDSLEMQKNSKQWKEQNGQFIPAPLTWINQERWTMKDPRNEIQAKIDEAVEETYKQFLF